jgi:AAA domain
MEAIIIDSTSHEWDGEGGCLQLNEQLASAKFKGNTWAAWSETTPRHQKFIEAIVTSKCHILTTARSKTDTIQTDDKKIKKVGTKEIQREGFEYELTANFNIDRDHHLAIASKDRTGLFIDRDPFLITPTIGKEIMEWNLSGIDGEALEAARLAQEEADRIALEEKQRIDRENLYQSLITEMQSVKFIDDLAALWNTQVQPNKFLLGDAYIKDLTDHKDAIKIELTKSTPPAEKKEAPKTPVAPVKTAELPKVAPVIAPVPADIKSPPTDTPPTEQSMITLYRDKIRATTTIDELDIVAKEINDAHIVGDMSDQDHGVIQSNITIWKNRISTPKNHPTPNPNTSNE